MSRRVSLGSRAISGARFVFPASPARDRAHALEATRTIPMKHLFDLGDRARSERSVVDERLALRLTCVEHDAGTPFTASKLQGAGTNPSRPVEPTDLTRLQQ